MRYGYSLRGTSSLHPFAPGLTEFRQSLGSSWYTYLLGKKATVAENLGTFPEPGNSPPTSVAPFHYLSLHMAPPKSEG